VLARVAVSGTEGDGWFVIAAGLVAAVLVFWHDNEPKLWKLGLLGIAGAIAFGVAAYDWSNLRQVAGDEEVAALVSPGWGVILSTLAGASAVAAAIKHWFRFAGGRFAERSRDPVPTEPDLGLPPEQPTARCIDRVEPLSQLRSHALSVSADLQRAITVDDVFSSAEHERERAFLRSLAR
jgi:hypothetical protein